MHHKKNTSWLFTVFCYIISELLPYNICGHLALPTSCVQTNLADTEISTKESSKKDPILNYCRNYFFQFHLLHLYFVLFPHLQVQSDLWVSRWLHLFLPFYHLFPTGIFLVILLCFIYLFTPQVFASCVAKIIGKNHKINTLYTFRAMISNIFHKFDDFA